MAVAWRWEAATNGLQLHGPAKGISFRGLVAAGGPAPAARIRRRWRFSGPSIQPGLTQGPQGLPLAPEPLLSGCCTAGRELAYGSPDVRCRGRPCDNATPTTNALRRSEHTGFHADAALLGLR